MNLTFDKPFFIYLHDNNLGAVSFAAVQSFFDSSTIVEPIPVPVEELPKSEVLKEARQVDALDDAKSFTELLKLERWSCGDDYIINGSE